MFLKRPLLEDNVLGSQGAAEPTVEYISASANREWRQRGLPQLPETFSTANHQNLLHRGSVAHNLGLLCSNNGLKKGIVAHYFFGYLAVAINYASISWVFF